MASNTINHQGLLIALLILAAMSLSCHLSHLYHYITKKMEKFNNMSKYNEISYHNLDDCSGLPCSEILTDAHPDIPDNLKENCKNKKKGINPEQEIILLLTKLRMAGKEVMNRGIDKMYPN